ncbi:MAG: class I SAM-dependent methyltransferase [Candidatus Omnitrophota bacterium]
MEKKDIKSKARTFYNSKENYLDRLPGDTISSRPRYAELANQLFGTVLDVGAGRGLINSLMRQNGNIKSITSCDISHLALRHNDAARSVQCFSDTLTFKDNSFDCVISVNSLEHFFDPEKCIKEMVRVADSLIVVTSPNFANPFLESESLRRKPLGCRIKIFLRKMFHVSPIFISPEYDNFTCDSDVSYELSARDLARWFKECDCDVQYITKHYRKEWIYRIILSIFRISIFKDWGPIVLMKASKKR